jgi:hypothetical protein
LIDAPPGDVRMAGMDGLARIGNDAAAQGRPPPCRLLCTGDTDRAPAAPNAALDAVPGKPVSLAALRDTLAAHGVQPGPGPAAAPTPAAAGPAPQSVFPWPSANST